MGVSSARKIDAPNKTHLTDSLEDVDEEQLGAKVLVVPAVTVQLRHRH